MRIASFWEISEIQFGRPENVEKIQVLMIYVSIIEYGEELCIRACLKTFHAKSGTINNLRNGLSDI